ncbi:hypothetical protein [Halomonas salina]|uniref:hypothetical protein n=1 Tax=Halomonas salina TaxID=42565 RepID=UPI0005501A04|nr:hypothetical protein [Halomonas salina]
MKGTLVGVNRRKGFIAIRTEEGELTVAELLGGYEVELEDEIRGDLNALGGETFYNITQDEELDVYVQGVQCSNRHARLLMG